MKREDKDVRHALPSRDTSKCLIILVCDTVVSKCDETKAKFALMREYDLQYDSFMFVFWRNRYGNNFCAQ